MNAVGIALAVFILVGLTSWVFFDAVDRGKKHAWLWALAVIATVPTGIGPFIVAAVYFFNRNSGVRREVAEGAALRLYLVVATFCTLVLAVVGASTALGIFLAHLVPDNLGVDTYRAPLASAISAGIVGTVLWWGHWRTLNRRVGVCADDGSFRAMFSLRRTELLTAMFLLGAAAALAALVLLEGAVSALIHAQMLGATAHWLPAVAPLIFAGGAALYHYTFYRRAAQSTLAARFHSMPSPPLVNVPQAPQRTAPDGQLTGYVAPTETATVAATPPAAEAAPPPPPIPEPPTPAVPSAGWYPQPDGSMRYWTGKAWTAQVLQPH